MERLKAHISAYWPYFALIFLAIAAYWPISLGINVMKYDAIDITFPYKYLTSTYVANGALPIWNPHIQLGLPIMSDPGTGLYYPLYWLNLILTGYSLNGHQWDLVIHLMIAGAGMFKLLRGFGNTRTVSFLFGAVFMLNGAFVANAQHMGWIISASWMPWVWYYFMKIWKQSSIETGIKFGLTLGLLVVSAYPVFGLITAYLIAAAGLYKLGRLHFRRYPWRTILFASIAFYIVADGYISAVLQGMRDFNRGNGIALDALTAGSLMPGGLVSLISPLAFMTDPAGTESFIPSMNLMYIGLIPISCGILYLLSPHKTRALNAFIAAAFLALLFGMADLIPLRRWAYHVIPGFDAFKFPGIFRHFFIFFLIPPAASVFSEIGRSKGLLHKYRWMLAVLALLLFAGAQWFVVANMVSVSTPATWIIILSFFVIYVALIFLLFNHSGTRKWVLYALILGDVFLVVQLGLQKHVVSEVAVNDLEAVIENYPKSYDRVPLSTAMLNMNTYSTPEFRPMVYNDCIIKKEFAHDGFYPLHLKSLDTLVADPNYWKILEQPLFFISHNTEGIPDTIPGAEINAVDYFPSDVTLEINVPQDGNLIFFQNKHDGWTAYLDGRAVEIETAYHTLMSVPVSAGQHQVQFRFQSNLTFNFYKSMVLTAVLMLSILFFDIKRRYFVQ